MEIISEFVCACETLLLLYLNSFVILNTLPSIDDEVKQLLHRIQGVMEQEFGKAIAPTEMDLFTNFAIASVIMDDIYTNLRKDTE